MSQKKRRPSSVLEWDMTELTDAELQHEFDLSYEVLHDIHSSFPPYNGGVAIKGMLKKIRDNDPDAQGEVFLSAVVVWKKRLQNAEDELERRFLLS